MKEQPKTGVASRVHALQWTCPTAGPRTCPTANLFYRRAVAVVMLAAGLMAGTAQGAWPYFLATGGDGSFYTNYPGTATQTVYGIHLTVTSKDSMAAVET